MTGLENAQRGDGMAESSTAQILAQLAAQRLTGPEFDPPVLQRSIRMRPSMYVGGTDARGLHETLLRLVDISAEEFLHGAQSLEVTLRDGLATIADDGPGLSGTPIAALDGQSLLEVAATTFLLDGRLRHDGAARSVIDIPAAAALAETFRLESCHQGRRFNFSMIRGAPTGPTHDLGPTERQGTRFEWRPDPVIFRQPTLDADLVRDRLRFLAAYRPGLVVGFEGEDGRRERFSCPAGMADRVRALAADRSAYRPVFAVQAGVPGLALDVAFQHVRGEETVIETYANGRRTTGDGAHWRGFQRGVIGLLRAKARERAEHEPVRVDSASFERGLIAVLSVDAANLQFESPTRDRVTNVEIEERVAAAVRTQLGVWLSEHPSLLETLLARAGRCD